MEDKAQAPQDGSREIERLHFEVAQSLASDYESIYYIDLDSGRYGIYSSQGQFTALDMQDEGRDFFSDAQRDVLRVVYDDDRAALGEVLRRETILRETEGGRTFRFTYRLVIEGKPVYYSMKAARSVLAESRLIIGVSNIDRQKELEREYEARIRHAMDLARRDELTGVRNRNAYIQAEAEINELLSAGEVVDFGLVVCDLNDLKAANDLLGHAAGDDLIRNACHAICLVFDHSPVFRIGGDEFLCVLREHDFAHRDELVAQLVLQSAEAVRANREAGVAVDPARPVIACGLAVFDPASDADVAAVFERADVAMYESKQRLKAEAEQSGGAMA